MLNQDQVAKQIGYLVLNLWTITERLTLAEAKVAELQTKEKANDA